MSPKIRAWLPDHVLVCTGTPVNDERRSDKDDFSVDGNINSTFMQKPDCRGHYVATVDFLEYIYFNYISYFLDPCFKIRIVLLCRN